MADGQAYDDMTVDELKAELERRELPKSGKKAELIERLQEADGGSSEASAQADEQPAAEAVEEPVTEAEAVPDELPSDDEPGADAERDETPGAQTAADAADEEDAEGSPAGRRRRGAAETSTRSSGSGSGTSAGQQPVHTVAHSIPRDEKGLVAVRASARYVRTAPRKARLVMDHIRGKRIDDARALLRHAPRAAATDIAKLLESAVANAENNFELDPDDLRIHKAFVDEGPTIKRFRPRALGRATPIHKRTSHMTITLTTIAAEPEPAKATAGGDE